MKCPNCGMENPDNAKFCQMCARALPPAYAQSTLIVTSQGPVVQGPHSEKMPGWAIVVIVILIVALVIGAVAGLTLTQPWSKIVVFVNNLYHDNEIGIYIDGKLVSVATIGYEQNIDFQGVYGVKPGTHTVGAEVAGVNGLTGSIGYMDTVKLGPFDAMEVWLEVG